MEQVLLHWWLYRGLCFTARRKQHSRSVAGRLDDGQPRSCWIRSFFGGHGASSSFALLMMVLMTGCLFRSGRIAMMHAMLVPSQIRPSTDNLLQRLSTVTRAKMGYCLLHQVNVYPVAHVRASRIQVQSIQMGHLWDVHLRRSICLRLRYVKC